MWWTCLKPLLVFFHVLGVATAHVAPPSDVVLHCGNLVNTVMWRYDLPPPLGLRFRVDIGKVFDSQGDVGPLWVDPPDLQADVSFLSDQREDYFLAVTAVLGEEESEAAPAHGISFSYYIDSPANQKCSLDLPPATVLDQQDNSVLLSFQHPWLIYQDALAPGARSKRRRRHEQLDKPLPVFKYDVIMDKKHHNHLRCTEEVCEHRLPVDGGRREHCAAITGELERISVLGTRDYCAQPVHDDRHVIIPVLVSLLILGAIVAILLMICRKKTEASSHLPRSLRFDGTAEEAPVASVPASDSSAPLMVEELPATSEESEPGGEARSRRMEEPEASGEGDAGESEEGEQQPYAENDGTMEDEDTEDTDNNAYEKRHVVVKMAPDEEAEGYRG